MKVLILAGGFGTRLWPLSTKEEPKQFLKIFGKKSLLQMTIERSKQFVSSNDIFIAANQSHISQVVEECVEEGVPSSNIIVEPLSKNTAPAIALALKTLLLEKKILENEPILVCPSDHWIEDDSKGFSSIVNQGAQFAVKGDFVLFGLHPTYPETGFGYIHAGVKGEVIGFKEKPSLEVAKEYIASKDHFWNSGLFCFTPSVFFNALKKHSVKLHEQFEKPLEQVVQNFESLDPISIDYALLEKVSNRKMLPFSLKWSDIGSWESIWKNFPKDNFGNVVQGNCHPEGCENTLILSEKVPVVALGVRDLLIVQTESATLVSCRGIADDVMRKAGGKIQAYEENKTFHRPWGHYTVLSSLKSALTKHIVVLPKCRTSLQYHHHRDEHWVVVKGVLEATVGQEVKIVKENESLFVPKGVVHRISNPEEGLLEMIEVQFGEILKEEDIVRIEDDFGRIEVPVIL